MYKIYQQTLMAIEDLMVLIGTRCKTLNEMSEETINDWDTERVSQALGLLIKASRLLNEVEREKRG